MINNKISLSAQNYQEFLLHIAALEWSIQDTITITDVSDIKSQNWLQCNLKPFEHQYRNLIYFFRKLPCALIADDVGLGKTISAGMILSELMARKFVERTLIIAPKILCSQWVSELKEHFGLTAVEANSSNFNSAILDLDNSIITATYETMRSKVSSIPQGCFQLCIFDEAHKFRNLYGNNPPPKVALNVREALKKRIFNYVLMLTATPMQNRIWDLYSLIDLLKIVEGEDNPLGNEYFFQQNYLNNRQGFQLKPEAVNSFRRVLQRNLCRTRRLDANLPFPTRELKDISYSLSNEELKIVNILKDIIQNTRLNRFQQISFARALFSSPQAFLRELENSNRNHGDYLSDYISRLRVLLGSSFRSSKMNIVLNILSKLRENSIRNNEPWRAVIFTIRIETLNTIAQCLEQHGFSYSTIQGGKPIDNQNAIKGYSKNPPDFNVIISTDSGAEGVNLQAGNVIINFDLPWNPMVVEQRIGRVQRLGSKYKNILIFNPYAENSIEGAVVHRLLTKLLGIAQSLGEIESILESANLDNDDIEKSIETMVLNFLAGHNVEDAIIQKEESFQRGILLYQKNLNEIEQKVPETNWDDVFSKENTPPKLTTQFHSMTEQEFFAKATGIDYQNIGNNQQNLIQNPEFTEQLSLWKNKAHEFVYEIPRPSNDEISPLLLKQWNALFPDTKILKIDIHSAEQDFCGQIYIKIEISNAIDRYQKEIPVSFNQEYESIVDIGKKTKIEDLKRITSTENLIQEKNAFIENAIITDSDICNFKDYYERRLEKKLSLTTNDALKHNFKREYENIINSETNAISGVAFDIIKLSIIFEIDGHEYEYYVKYNTILKSIISPSANQCHGCLKTAPAELLQKCNLTEQYYLPHYLIELSDGRHIIKSEAEQCYICNQYGVRNEMIVSQNSHKYGHKEHLIECAYSHQLSFPDEMDVSDLSQRRVRKQYIQISEKTGRKGVVDEFSICSLTHKALLNDELGKRYSDGLLYDKDLLSLSPVSNRYEFTNLMKKCELTNTLVIEDELCECCISHKKIRIDKAAQSPISFKLFIPELGKVSKDGILLPEFEICSLCGYSIQRTDEVYTNNNIRHHLKHYVKSAITGKYLLPANADVSDYSHKYAEPEFFKSSQLSGRKGLPEEMRICAQTHELLLMDEACYSNIDKQWYKKDLCKQSSFSHNWGLQTKMVQCEVTGSWLFPDERVRCALSGKWVMKSLTTKSPVSGNIFCKNLAIKTVHGELIMPNEGLWCPLSNGYLKKSDMGKCKKTGLVISKRFLVDNCLYSLQVLANAIIGNDTKESVWKPIPNNIINALQKLNCWDSSFNLKNNNIEYRYWPITNNIATFYAVRKEKQFLGLITKYNYFYGVFEIKDKAIRILGQPEKCVSNYKIGK